ncbi:MAG: DNA polymerase III subunit delta' [Selenomonadaceae bacterium]|nr:DNA polymerase III subunit delta' [Selenomonadaceae bacterium]
MEKIFSWKNIVGNSDKIAQLKKFSADKKFPHALLFAGVEGIGKRKIAETCAASLICENPIDGEPCGTCESCKLMAANSHPDFYVVEPEDTKTARNIKIGQIRDLQREAFLRPIQAERRVVIIDGAEFMNKAAANCILKTLEEPPSQTIFILLTANRAGLLLTIRSRCMTINFDKLTAAQIKKSLTAYGIDDAKAQKLSVISDGSLGRALTLEKSGGYELRDDALTLIKQVYKKELTDEIIFAKGKIFETYSRENFSDFVTYVQKILRDVFAFNKFELYNSDLKDKIAEIKFDEENLYRMIAEGTQVQRRLKSNANLRLLAESYLMRLRMAV